MRNHLKETREQVRENLGEQQRESPGWSQGALDYV